MILLVQYRAYHFISAAACAAETQVDGYVSFLGSVQGVTHIDSAALWDARNQPISMRSNLEEMATTTAARAELQIHQGKNYRKLCSRFH